MEEPDQAFRAGLFVYDADAQWDKLRSGMTATTEDGRPGVWWAASSRDELKKPSVVEPLPANQQSVRTHILMYMFGGAASDETEDLREIYRSAFAQLKSAPRRSMLLDDLRSQLGQDSTLKPELIDDVLKMMGTMGALSISKQGGKLRVTFAKLLEEGHRRRDYLATFTNELMEKSRRIDLLIGHHGTKGSYREELLRGLLVQLLPKRYEATSGFIEGCARQLDIIVWDSQSYAPLFREQGIVVVPLAAVRAVIEVKTTLSDGPLRRGMEILWDTFRNRQTVVPIFKGIFAFEPELQDAEKVANVMRSFYRSKDSDGLLSHEHGYHWAGTSAVCVRGHCLVRESYPIIDDSSHPQPRFIGLQNAEGDDAYSALFLGLLLNHLDLDSAAKQQNRALFEPVMNLLDDEDLGPIYDSWKPSSAIAGLTATLRPDGSNTYVQRVSDFFAGKFASERVAEGLDSSGDEAPPAFHMPPE